MTHAIFDPTTKVRAFHERFGIPAPTTPQPVGGYRAALRASLIDEEAVEYCDAVASDDYEGQVDALCDLLYVVLGSFVEMGLNPWPFFDEVHRANMRKAGGGSRRDGKVLKPEGWQPPNHAQVFDVWHPGAENPMR